MKSLATFTWQELLSVTQGEAVSHHRSFEGATVDTDTRTMEAGSFFLPLKGENFDGNHFIEKAFESHAEGAFVTSEFLQEHPELKRFPNLIAVSDPLTAYLSLAQFHRNRSKAKIVAITGSSGKTTTKEMLYTMLATVLGNRVQKSEKNYNNEIGVAMTLLNIQPESQVLILEMGMRGLGQIALLSRYAQPDIGIVTNVGPAHIGLLGSLEAIAKAKCEIFSGMDPETGFGIINGDDPLLPKEAGRSWNGCLESFSLHEVDEVHTLPDASITFSYEDHTFTLGLPGSHNVMNALACIKACQKLGISLRKITESLAHFEAGGGRWHKSPVEGHDNLWIINDAYNANPASMQVAITAFMDSHYPGLRKIAILGGMAELGDYSEKYHREIGEWLATSRSNLECLIVVGKEAKPIADALLSGNIQTYYAETNAEAVCLIQQNWSQDAIFLLKGSRAYHLEEIAELLKVQNAVS